MPENDNIYNCYKPPAEEFVRGEGAYLYTEDGEKYLDFIAGIAVNGLGHNHPALVGALKEQAGKLWHLSNMFKVQGGLALAEKYCAATFADKVFFTNSGAEAVECAMKTARRCQFVEGHPERYEIITAKGAFHGRTFATINAGGNPKYLEGFGPSLPGFINVPFGDMDAIKAAMNENTAAILVEPVQGEGGVRALPVQFLKDLRTLCDENGLLLIYDEVQSGAGRTGKLFAHQWAGISADVVPIAKGLGSGVPIGAVLAHGEAAELFQPGNHGTTFGGNPLATATALAVVNTIDGDKIAERASELSSRISSGLQPLVASGHIKDLRCKGMMFGLDLGKPCGELVARGLDQGLIINVTADSIVRLLPTLNLSDEDADELIDRVSELIKSFDAS